MKKLIFKHSNPVIKTITDKDGIKIPISKALKIVLAMGVNQAPAGIEEFRKWVTIGNKLDSDDIEIELEDDQLDFVKNLFKRGVDKAFPTMESKPLATEVDRILNEAKDIK